MKTKSIDYHKTVKENKLSYDGKTFWLVFSIIIITLISGGLVITLGDRIISNLLEGSSTFDYLFGILFILLTLPVYYILIRKILNRHKLREIAQFSNPIFTKRIIHLAASYLNWEILDENDKIIILSTDLGPEMDRQLITIIFDPDNKILFSCIPWQKIHFRRTRFDYHFSNFQEHYKKYSKHESN